MRPAIAALVICGFLAGCLSGAQASCPEPGFAQVLMAPDTFPLQADPRQPSDVVYLVEGLEAELSPTVGLLATRTAPTAPGGRETDPVVAARTTFASGTPSQRLERLRFEPGDLQQGVQVDWRVTYDVPAGCEASGGGLHHALQSAPAEGRILGPGQGAHVWYAGFFANGTLFETNLEAFDSGPWPRASWYEQVPYEPLPVYIYDQSPSEKPAYWRGIPGTATETPADPIVATGQGTIGLGYYSTIKGFNDGLKGLSTTATRVMYMDAKDAYPEVTPDNPVSGHNLVFFVQLADVVDFPCPSPSATGPVDCPKRPN